MAFAFFRRRQKMVIIIMAVLMVSFLIGFQGFNTLFSRSGGKELVCKTKFGKVTLNDLTSAADQLDILRRDTGLGIMIPEFARPEDLACDTIVSNADQDGRNGPALVYAMLLQEAEEKGEDVTDSDVDRYFAGVPYPIMGLKDYQDLIDRLNSQGKVTEKQLRGIVANWIKVYRLFEDSWPNIPPSEPQLRRLYRDLYEQIALRIVKFPADDFVKDVPEPTPEQVNEQFEKYRRNLEGSYPDETSFGFGYYQLPKVRISWFAIRPYVVARVVNVSDEDVRRHYRENKAKYVKKVPIETAATTQGDEGATSKPVEYRTEEMDINEAWDQIVVELKVSTVISKMNKIISSVEKKADKAAKNPDDVYEGILGNMRKDTAAAEILTKRIESLTVKNEPLENAVKILAEHMKLNGICFPWGTYDGFTIDPKTEISFTAQGTPLGDVLKDITKQAFSKAKTEEGAAAPEVPDLQWSMVEGFDGVLFPLDTGDVMMFPFAASTTALLTGSEISKDRVLGLCCDNPGSSNPQYLISVAFSRDAVEVTSGGGIYVGPKMQTLFGDQVLWRIIGTTPAHVPDSITDSKGLRDKVVADLKLEAAYQTAIKKADEFMALAAKDGVEKAAENEKLKSTKTELFTRRGSSGWSDIEGLDLPYRAGVARLNLMEQVFKLVPENPEPPYPDTPPAVMALYIPAIRATAVVQRIDYKPAYEDKYENIRQGLAGVIMQGAKKEAIEYWFAKSTVMSRLDYKPEEK